MNVQLHDLFLSCKKGDLDKVKYIIDELEIEPNVRDAWDSTPLYYACLCGQEEVVEYLLDRGAKCEANTFDGERCLYAALTDHIRRTLRQYRAVTSHTFRRDRHHELLRRMLEQPLLNDVTFLVHGVPLPGHRCVLSARCGYFARQLAGRWEGKQEIVLNHKLLDATSFKLLLDYIYTGRVQVALEQVEGLERLGRQCDLTWLVGELGRKVQEARRYEMSKSGVRLAILVLECCEDHHVLKKDLARLAEAAKYSVDPSNVWLGVSPPLMASEEEEGETREYFPDVCFMAEGRHFLCHKAFFCGRSDYFRALVEDHFQEACPVEVAAPKDKRSLLPLVPLQSVTSEVFAAVVDYVYTDTCDVLDDTRALELVVVGDIYLLPGLKRRAAGALATTLQVGSVVDALRTARLFRLTQLEDACAVFIATYLHAMVLRPDFAAVVQEDADDVTSREETDSIAIVDDVRFHITSHIQTFSEMQEAEEKLAALDVLLDTLGLVA